MLQELRKLFHHSAYQIHRYYKDSEKEIARNNVLLLVFISICGFVLVGGLLIITPYLIPDWNITVGHILFIPFFLAYFFIGLYLHDKPDASTRAVHILVLTFLFIFMGLILYINFVPFSNSSATMATVAMVVLPVLLIVPFHEVVLLLAVTFAAFLYLNANFILESYRYSNYFNGIVGLFTGIMVAWVISDSRARDSKDRLHLLKMSEIDKLTGVMNKAAIEDRCRTYFNEHGGEPYALIVIDIDSFKSINDTWGHHIGDIVLEIFGGAMRRIFRENDYLGRIGGDEFLILMKKTSNPDLITAKMAALVELVQQKIQEKVKFSVTCSYGSIVADGDELRYLDVFNMADKLLYRSKNSGKSQGLVLAPEDYRAFMKKDKVMLIVDDMEDARAMVVETFSRDYVAMEAHNGAEAIKLIGKYHSVIDIMILDVCMPEIDGFHVLDWMTEQAYRKDFPVVVMSSDEQIELKALEYGVEEMIRKPVMPEILQKRVEKVMRYREAHMIAKR